MKIKQQGELTFGGRMTSACAGWIKIGLAVAMLTALTGCIGFVDGGGPVYDGGGWWGGWWGGGGGYERGHDVHGFSARGAASRGEAHGGGGGHGGGHKR
jgi:hypothetical protein